MNPSRFDPDALVEQLPPRRGWAVFALLAATVALVYLANLGARTYVHTEGTNRGYRIVNHKWAMLEALDEPVDWLILGDSTAGHAMVPSVWSEVLGGRAVNLGVIANVGVINDAWMLERYIERFGPPRGVVVVHAHDIWHRGVKAVLLGQVDRPWGFWTRHRPTLPLSVDELETVALARFLPLYADNRQLRDHLWHRGQPEDPRLEFDADGWIHGRGHMPDRLAADRRRLTRHLESTTGFRLSEPNRAGLQRLGRLGSVHDVPIYLAHAPIWSGLAGTEAFGAYAAERNRRLGKIAGAWRNLTLLTEVDTFPLSALEGHLDHLTPAAAPGYTRRLAERVAARFRVWKPRGAKPEG